MAIGDSLQDVSDLINFDYSDESRAEIGPVDADEYWVMFANVEESTRIYIRMEQ